MTTDLDRFIACMEYQPCDRRPNHELAAWPQTKARWRQEAPDIVDDFHWYWFEYEPKLRLDTREYISIDYGFIPPYETEILEQTPEYEIVRNSKGIVTRALIEGTVDGGRMCMDEYLRFPVESPEDWPAVKARLEAGLPARRAEVTPEKVARWKQRDYPLILGHNCQANGFYWRAREFMGTENLSFAWYDYPEMMHEMMEWYADFVIEVSKPVLEQIDVEYFTLNEDLSMKNGPLLSPDTFKEFIFPHLKRLVEFMKSHGVRYFALDTDGNPTVLIPLFMDAGVDVLWPLERASDVSPQEYRKRFGKSLRMWGGIDKRILPLGPEAINAHLREFIPLVEEGGFIPGVDHTVPPDVSWDNFRYFMDAKWALLCGDYAALE